MPITWYAHSGNIDIDSPIWYTQRIGGSLCDFASCNSDIILNSNGFRGIRLNRSFTCNRLENSDGSGSLIGYFEYTGTDTVGTNIGSIVINGGILGEYEECIRISGSSLGEYKRLTINGSISSLDTAEGIGISIVGENAYLTINGNIENFGGNVLYINAANAHILIIGDVTGNGSFMGSAVQTTTNAMYCTITIEGNCFSENGPAVSILGSFSTLYIEGNAEAGFLGLSSIVILSNYARLIITGTCKGQGAVYGVEIHGDNIIANIDTAIGGSYSGGGIFWNGANMEGGSSLIVRDAIGGDSSVGIDITQNPSLPPGIIVTGSVIGGINASGFGIWVKGSVGCIIKGNIIDSPFCSAYCGPVRVEHNTENYHLMYHSSDNGTGNQPRYYPLALSPDLVKRGIKHGTVVGTLAGGASPFRRLNRFV
ncbi:MAG: hypothetical protein A2Y10_08570 [Planctomycetes bacterium GWF2_41_51]|nr:MAG: hypothetical protein A2Y10_08570 [Planctomycetes bacterium GWF2_41_51]HBG28587.1 hypothetical protein [Phycisphaerales bacterium]